MAPPPPAITGTSFLDPHNNNNSTTWNSNNYCVAILILKGNSYSSCAILHCINSLLPVCPVASEILANNAPYFNSLLTYKIFFNSRKSSWSWAMMTVLNSKCPFLLSLISLSWNKPLYLKLLFPMDKSSFPGGSLVPYLSSFAGDSDTLVDSH